MHGIVIACQSCGEDIEPEACNRKRCIARLIQQSLKRARRRVQVDEALREKNRRYYRTNRERHLEHARRYYWKNRERILEYGRRYYWANREQIREQARIRDARMIALEEIFYPNEPEASPRDRYLRRSALMVVAREMGFV